MNMLMKVAGHMLAFVVIAAALGGCLKGTVQSYPHLEQDLVVFDVDRYGVDSVDDRYDGEINLSLLSGERDEPGNYRISYLIDDRLYAEYIGGAYALADGYFVLFVRLTDKLATKSGGSADEYIYMLAGPADDGESLAIYNLQPLVGDGLSQTFGKYLNPGIDTQKMIFADPALNRAIFELAASRSAELDIVATLTPLYD